MRLRPTKWLLVAFVLVTTITLVSCNKRRAELLQADIGVGPCDDPSIGETDVYVKRSDAQPDLFEIYNVPVSLVEESFYAQFNVFNTQPASKLLNAQVVLYSGQAYFLGYLSTEEIQFYTEFAISPTDPSTTFLEQQTDQFARCALPLPGDGVDYGGDLIGARSVASSSRAGKRLKASDLHPTF